MRQHRPSCLDGPRSPVLLRRCRVLSTGGLNRGMVSARAQIPCGSSSCAPRTQEADLRPQLVQRIRAELAAGTYLTDDKWEMALARLCGELRDG